MLDFDNELKKISADLNSPSNIIFLRNIFIPLFVSVLLMLILRFVIFMDSSRYNFIILLFGLIFISFCVSSLIMILLYVPIRNFVKKQRLKKFEKNKGKIDSILQKINAIYRSLNDFPLSMEEYVNEFYITELINYMQQGAPTLESAIDKLAEEVDSNKKLAIKVKTANVRIEKMNRLFKLSVKEGVTYSYQTWCENNPYAKKR